MCFTHGFLDNNNIFLLRLQLFNKSVLTMLPLCAFLCFQVCETQRNDLQLLQLNLESANETLKEKAGQCPGGR